MSFKEEERGGYGRSGYYINGSLGLGGDVLKLSNAIDYKKLSDGGIGPMSHKELEILFALASASSYVRTETQGKQLLSLLSPYFLQCSTQEFKSNISLQLSPSPWDYVTMKLTSSITTLGEKFPSLEDDVVVLFKQYLARFKKDGISLCAYFSLLGFLKALIGSDSSFDALIVDDIIDLFTEQFFDTVESATQNSLQDEHHLTYLVAYLASGDEFNSLLFAKLAQALFSHIVLTTIAKEGVLEKKQDLSLSETLLSLAALDYDSDPGSVSKLERVKTALNTSVLEKLVRRSKAQIDELDNGAPYINLSSTERVNLALSTKSIALDVLAAGLLVDLVSNQEVTALVKLSLINPNESVNPDLSRSSIAVGSLLTYKDKKNISAELIHLFPLILSKLPSSTDVSYIKMLSKSLALGLKPLNQDSIITTIYSLVNLLVSNNTSAPVTAMRELKIRSTTNSFNHTRVKRSSTINSLKETDPLVTAPDGKPVHGHIYKNAITSIIELTKTYGDEAITVLAVTVLSQKFQSNTSPLGFNLLKGLSEIATSLSHKEFLALMKLFDNALITHKDNPDFTAAVINARVTISKTLQGQTDHDLYFVYLNEMLNNVVSRGDVRKTDHRSQGEISEIAKQISYLIKPIAQLLPVDSKLSNLDDTTLVLFQNFWFNVVVHGYNETSELTKKYQTELEIIALNSPPLASDLKSVRAETSFELNTVLRRGSSNHNVKDQKHIISGISNINSLEKRTLSYTKLMFLSATSLLENLRANTGDCSTILYYFSDPSIANSNIERFIGSISISVVQKYIQLTEKSGSKHFTCDKIADQLTKILILCCHREYSLQDAAFQSASLFISRLTSGLVNRLSLYTLLDLLTAMFDSVVDSERSKYQPRREFTLAHSQEKIKVSDSIKWKRSTLERLHRNAKQWCLLALSKSNQDLKALLQSYISDLGLQVRANPVQFGVTFAMEMAGSILPNDLENSNVSMAGLGKANSIAGFLSEYGWRAKHDTGLSDIDGDSKDPLMTLIRAHKSLMSSGESVRLGDPNFEARAHLLLSDIAAVWQTSIKNRVGVFSKQYDLIDEGFLRMAYTPSDQAKVNYYADLALEGFETDFQVIKFFTSHFEGTMYQSENILRVFTRVVCLALERSKTASLHPYARLVRFELVNFGFDVMQVQLKTNPRVGAELANLILESILSWFTQSRQYPFGDNDLRLKSDLNLLKTVYRRTMNMTFSANSLWNIDIKRTLCLAFLHDEISKIIIWLNPLEPVDFKEEPVKVDEVMLKFAYSMNPALAISLVAKIPSLDKYLFELVVSKPVDALPFYQSVRYLLASPENYKYLIFAKAIDPTESINLFTPPYIDNPYVIQYNMRALESQDINLTFFYVPQIVQCLLNDSMGYVARFIAETGKVSQKFSHQLIWNLKANAENKALCSQEMINQIIDSYDDEAMEYYKAEFGFFDEVTSISGKLMPYLKKTKAEKKIKIDEEMAKIVVAENVYLPSNPDGVLIDINRTSGKPLQSHAKTPFMATFRIRREEEISGQMITVEKWQSAIFKVGDDCRQDVLALQLIAIFKSIWENAGLNLYCYPNRVTATAPGCGVIDVLPNSISRDMLGREAVNDLYTFFKSKFPDGVLEYEDAVQNFVKSLAAYSIISYLLQFKDRHNGNIMYDDHGHILHIDFGFCFDIVPGGVKFEACPFKLTKEMVRVMGGSNDTESFKMFEELFIKGFLAVRPYYGLIVGNVQSMLASGLPCFKGEKTMRNLKARFFLDKDDKQCIKALKGLIRQSYESLFSVGYDKFQKMTNGIPY
ncbi:1-phosphatidylinositol 4-kinase STT4 CYBJADRAFT_166362 [Cyberlindnera jadinii NRRL Y-1542]|uniref:1-phosphatidylinositol 4-kinase n=1 Tax=Cyberlindnera jadinii (strain ATCC 18201 / CBS 1600 / BCRC 20928 / JCM 3617 / NBRC 0987 / NRRL Y-1542) TaxID=983966 RepID=A0A1E4S831_CYBJN|nr:hypothetical protein CYBJADRAFT_166362 [Cyberlindnera jadinii NRRL Y-1542]ODV75656.1 hypothetical protein CYBJADRAFT_166362 [Cyberlindnera jadinii NRRL Y-1542]